MSSLPGLPFAGPFSKSSIGLRRSASMTTPNGTSDNVDWVTAIWDNDAWWSSSVNPDQITVNMTGAYYVSFIGTGSATGAGNFITTNLRVNSTTIKSFVGSTQQAIFPVPLFLSEGDIVTIQIVCNNVSAGSASIADNFLTLIYLGRGF